MKRLIRIRCLLTMLAVLGLGGVMASLSSTTAAAAGSGQEIVAYYGNWDIYGNKYFLKNVDNTAAKSGLTTLVYSFENIDPVNLTCLQTTHAVDVSESNPNGGDGGGDAWGDYQRPFLAEESVNGHADIASQQLKGNFNQLKQLKASHPNLKVLVSIGGWTFSKFFSDAAATPASRSKFVSSCIDMYIKGNLPTGIGNQPEGGAGVAAGIFDGIDIDWEFPAGSDGKNTGHLGNHASPNDASNYVALMREFRTQLNGFNRPNGKPYLLTAAVESGLNAATLTKASQFLPYLDWAGVMTYDMHGAWETTGPTNFQAPLYPSLTDPKASEKLSVDQSIQRWKDAGWPASKLMVGLPFYWRGWSGVGSASNGLYQTATGASKAYPTTNQAGVANYKELMGVLKTANTIHYDPVTQSPWVYTADHEFYTGDTNDTLKKKAAYIRGKGLGGAMIYALEGDDSTGSLLKSVATGLSGNVPMPVPDAAAVIAGSRTVLSSPNTATNGEPINMIGGNYLAARHDLTLPNRDNPVDFTLSYSSSAANQPSSVGWGWKHGYDVSAVTDTDGSVVVRNPDGRMDRFTKNGSAYVAPTGMFDTLTLTNGLFKVVHKDRSVYTFNAKGQLASIVSANGTAQTLSYDTSDLLSKITDAFSRSLTLTYNDLGQLAKVSDPSGRTVSYTYDGVGDLRSVTNPAGQTTSYAYDDAHHLTTLTDPRGNAVVVNVYDDQGRVAKQTNGLGSVLTLAYAAGQTTYTDGTGGATTYSYDTGLRLTKVKDALGGVSTQTYDAAGNLYQTTDPLGRTTSRLYDARGNLTQVTDPAGGLLKFTYDAQDNLLTRTDQLNHTTTYSYDAAGNVKQKKDPAGNLTKLTYNAGGQPTAVTDPLNNQTGFAYDKAGNLVTKTDASNRNTYLGYDSIGRATSIEDADNNETVSTLDAMNRVTKVTDPDDHATDLAYDADGNKTKLTDANGHATSYAYDANNNLSKVTNALGQITSYSYDKNDNLVKVTDAKAHVKSYAFDLLNRQTHSIDALGNVTRASYDAVGNMVSRTDASNRTTTYSYDVLDRRTKITYPDGTATTYTYNAVGDVLTATNSAGTTTYAYDVLGRVITVKDPHAAVVTYSYNAADELTQLKYPDGKLVSYTYTPAKQLSTVKDWNNATTTYLYNNEGRVAVKSLPNSIKGTYSYDDSGHLTDLVYTKGGSALTSFNYERDAVGNVTDDDETKANGTENYSEYTYDALDQLTMDDAPAHTWKYSYDAVGNMATSIMDGAATTYTSNAANQLTSAGTRTLTYDKQGNELTDASKTITYSFDNQLKSFTSAGVTTGYVYDAAGNRTEKNGSTKYQYVNTGNNNVLVTKNVTSGNSTYNLFGNDLISQGGSAAPDRQYYLTDGLGNVRYLTTGTGATLNSYTYDPFGGNQTNTGSATNTYRYQAEQNDTESGLVFLRARYLDPVSSRFLSRDSASGSLKSSVTQNGYSYANANPVTWSDHTGEWAIVDCYTASVTILHFSKSAGLCINMGGDGYSVIATGGSGVDTGRVGASIVNTWGGTTGDAQAAPLPSLDLGANYTSRRAIQYSGSVSRASDGALTPSIGLGLGISDKPGPGATLGATRPTVLTRGSWSQLGSDWRNTIAPPGSTKSCTY